MAKFSLATNERYKDKEGNWQDRTEWHNIVLWERLAEIAGEYLKKGGKVYIEGRIRTDSWDDKQTGQKKYMTQIVGNDIVLLSGRGEGGAGEHLVAARAEPQLPRAATTSIRARLSRNTRLRGHRLRLRMRIFLSSNSLVWTGLCPVQTGYAFLCIARTCPASKAR